MPVDFFGPFPGSAIGPGVQVFFRQIDFGTLPAGSAWVVEVGNPLQSPFQPVLRHQFVVPSPPTEPISFLVGDPGAGTLTFPSFRPNTLEGTQVDLRVQLLEGGTGEILTTGVQSQVWDASFAWKLPVAGSGGGEPSEDIQVIKAAVTTQFPDVGSVLTGLADFIAHPPLALIKTEQINPPRTGNGRLIHPNFPSENFGVTAYGLTWFVTQAPPGLGSIDGNPLTFRSRILQTSTIFDLADGTQWIDEEQEWNLQQVLWFWRRLLPTYVDYSILPGVTLQFYWLVGVQHPTPHPIP